MSPFIIHIRENLEESVVRTGRDFPAGEIPVFRRDLPVSMPR